MRNIFRSKKLIVVVIVLLLGTLLYNTLWFGTARVLGTDITAVTIGDRTYTEVEFSKGIKLRPGGHTLTAHGPLIRPTEHRFTVGPLGRAVATPSVERLDEASLIKEVASRDLPADMAVGKGKLLENNTWLVVLIYSPDGQVEGYTKIYHFDGKDWQVFESGTGFELEGYNETGFPDSVVNYLRSGD